MQLGTCFITLKSYIKSMFMSMSLTSNIKLISNVYRSDLLPLFCFSFQFQASRIYN